MSDHSLVLKLFDKMTMRFQLGVLLVAMNSCFDDSADARQSL